MIRAKSLWLVVGLVLALAVPTLASDWVIPGYPTAESAIRTFHNETGMDVTGIHLEFEEEVTIISRFDVGGILMELGPQTGTTFDYYGSIVSEGTVIFEWQPMTAVPALVTWMNGETPAGAPFFTSLAVLGRLFGQGIVAVREAAPEMLNAAFEQFFADNGEYLAGLSASLGMEARVPLQQSFNQTSDLPGFCMTSGLQLGVNQISIHRDLEAAAIRWHQGDGFDLELILLDQLSHQTDGPIGRQMGRPDLPGREVLPPDQAFRGLVAGSGRTRRGGEIGTGVAPAANLGRRPELEHAASRVAATP